MLLWTKSWYILLSKAKFESLATDLIKEQLIHVKSALKMLVYPSDIDEIILVRLKFKLVFPAIQRAVEILR
jgi:molecular chaperone DnaK (HSP70)